MGKVILAWGKGGQRHGRVESLPSQEEGVARLGEGTGGDAGASECSPPVTIPCSTISAMISLHLTAPSLPLLTYLTISNFTSWGSPLTLTPSARSYRALCTPCIALSPHP